MPAHVSGTKIWSRKTGDEDQWNARVLIGEGQVGGWAAFVGARLKAKGRAEDQDWFPIGSGTTLKSRGFLVQSNVMNLNEQTDDVRVTVRIRTEGGATSSYTMKETLESWGSADFTHVILFKE